MSFEDLQKLKERLGTKIYNETMFGKKSERRQKKDFKRESKSAPAEMSAKRRVSVFKKVIPTKNVRFRDPRFDSLSGTFDNKSFKSSYAFLTEYKQNDLENLRKELEVTTDPKTIKKIKYLIQRFENQLREEKRQKQKEEDKQKEKEQLLEAIKRGEKPIYKKKCMLFES
jgi:ribosomal RNA-processing protein 36